MPRIKLFLMRHSKSCNNHIRHNVNVDAIAFSQEVRDPALSTEGHRVAALYGPLLQQLLTDAGFDVKAARICSSTLRRAKETAALVFGRKSQCIEQFTENGAIPENTPEGFRYIEPNWPSVVKQLSKETTDGESVVIVGHGSYLRSLWPTLTGAPRTERLHNLEGILLDITVHPSGRATVHGHREFPCPPEYRASDRLDTCTVRDTRKIAALHKKMRKQRGGMPQGFHQPGAQFVHTSPTPTGVETVFPTDGAFVRAPLHSQAGGFYPSVMGAFAANGSSLVPVAGYMGYKMFSNNKQKTTRKNKKTMKKSKSKHRTRRRRGSSRA